MLLQLLHLLKAQPYLLLPTSAVRIFSSKTLLSSARLMLVSQARTAPAL